MVAAFRRHSALGESGRVHLVVEIVEVEGGTVGEGLATVRHSDEGDAF
jgi:hypothetical protein